MDVFYEFESFRVDVKKRLLFKDGNIISIKPKTFDTLLVLLKNKNEIISKDDLIEDVWHGVAVSDDSLTQQISQLRKLLGESADKHKFIVTVPGIGYKFVADVHNTKSLNGDNSLAGESQLLRVNESRNKPDTEKSKYVNLDKTKPNQSQKSEQTFEKFTTDRKRTWLIAIAAFVVLGLAAIFYWASNEPEKINALGVKKLAVLPFRAVTEDNDIQALKNGMTDSLITRLSRINELSVLPSALVGSYKNSELSPLEFGKQIGADAVLDGIIRKNGEDIFVNVQLFDVKEGKVLWSDSFQSEFTDILEVQSLITHKIAEALSLELSAKERVLMKRYTNSAEAYRLFLDANYIQRFRRGIEARTLAENYYERAIELDPNFAMAYVNLANLQLHSPSRKAYSKMKMLAEQTLAIDPELGEAYSVLGFSVWRGNWDWKDSEKHLKKAIELAPHDYGSYGTYSMILAGQGKFDEALKINQSDKSGSKITFIYEIAIYFFKYDFDKTIELCLLRLEENPKNLSALSYLAPAYSFKGMHAEAIETAEKYAALDETADVGSLVYLSLAYIKAGQIEKGREILQRMLKREAPDSAQIHGGLAMLFGELGEKDKAFEHIDKSIENREWWAFTLKVAPYFDSLRGDPRFNEKLRQINLEN